MVMTVMTLVPVVKMVVIKMKMLMTRRTMTIRIFIMESDNKMDVEA